MRCPPPATRDAREEMDADMDALRATDAKLRAAFKTAKKFDAKLFPLGGMLHMAVRLGAPDNEILNLFKEYKRLSTGLLRSEFIHDGVPLVYLAMDQAVLQKDYRVLHLMKKVNALNLSSRYNVFSKIATSYGDEGVELARWMHPMDRPSSMTVVTHGEDYTPLMLAAKKGSTGLVQLILEMGRWSYHTAADWENRLGESALSLADENGHEECARLIETHLFEWYTASDKVDYDRAVTKMAKAEDMAKAKIAATKAAAKDLKRKRQDDEAEMEAEMEAAAAKKPMSQDEAVAAA